MKKLKLRQWVKVLLFWLLLLLLFFILKDLITKKEVITTEGKNYTCNGSIIKVCAGYNYDI